MLKRKKGRNSNNPRMSERLANYIRTHRKNAGLTLQEIATLLSYSGASAVAHHERRRALPSLVMAIGYSVVFRVPIPELFAGLHDGVRDAVERRLLELEHDIRRSSLKPLQRSMAARKLQWLSARRDLPMQDTSWVRRSR